MKTDTPASIEAPAPDKRSRDKRVLLIVGFLFGLLFARSGKFLADYDGPGEIKLAVVLALFAVIGLLVLLPRFFHQEDELEILINRQALAFAVWAAMLGLAVLYPLEAAGFVPKFEWSTRGLLGGLGVLVGAGILWSQRRFA